MTLEEGIVILLRAIYFIAFIYGVLLIFDAAWKVSHSRIAEGLNGILGALLLAMGPSLIQMLFTVFNLPGGTDLW